MRKYKYLNDKDPWMLAEDIPDIDLFFSKIWLSCFTNEFKNPSGRAYKKVLTVFKGYHLWFYYGKNDSYLEGEHIVNKFIKNPKFTQQVNKQIVREADKLRNYVKILPEEDLNIFSNKQLWQMFARHDQIHTHYYQWSWIPVAVDMFHNNLTEKLKSHLRDLNVREDKINEYLVLLTQPTKKSLIQKEQEEFLRIAVTIYKNSGQKKVFKDYYKLIQDEANAKYGLKTHTEEYENFLENKMSEVRSRINKNILRQLEKLYQRYCYVKFMWIGKEGVYSFDHYLKEMIKFIGSGANPVAELNDIKNELEKVLNKRKKLIKKLKIKNPWRTIIDSWGDFMVTKIYRRYAQIFAIYRMQPVLKEISKRLNITLRQVKFMLPREIKRGLLQHQIDRLAIKQRVKFCVYYTEKNSDVVFTGKKAKVLAESVKQKKIDYTGEIKGQTGCIGKATGIVKLIIRPRDMAKMKRGDILVSIATDPDIVPAMKKAAAIVTEQGGVTSHAAIVSREMNIPCVIGTKIATKVLKDGDKVEVDANKGIVKKI